MVKFRQRKLITVVLIEIVIQNYFKHEMKFLNTKACSFHIFRFEESLIWLFESTCTREKEPKFDKCSTIFGSVNLSLLSIPANIQHQSGAGRKFEFRILRDRRCERTTWRDVCGWFHHDWSVSRVQRKRPRLWTTHVRSECTSSKDHRNLKDETIIKISMVFIDIVFWCIHSSLWLIQWKIYVPANFL